jgi:rhomboid protease GluP
LSLPPQAIVFQGPRALCREYSLVLEAKAIEHEVIQDDGDWRLAVAPAELHRAYEEIGRYAGEHTTRRAPPRFVDTFPGASYGALGFAAMLMFVAYAAGIHLFHSDWLARGAVDASAEARHEWWRAATALTLHADQMHLLSNLLSGTVAGIAASRMVGPGIAWAAGTLAAILANGLEMAISPSTHLAIGASTLVFALLGLITGLAWADKIKDRERTWHRWAPVFAGLFLLALFGGGGGDPASGVAPAHVDVLGHLLGFISGTGVGWRLAKSRFASIRSATKQAAVGIATAMLIGVAWLLALGHT